MSKAVRPRGIIARGIKRALGHFIQVFLLCRIIGKVHILVKVEHIAMLSRVVIA